MENGVPRRGRFGSRDSGPTLLTSSAGTFRKNLRESLLTVAHLAMDSENFSTICSCYVKDLLINTVKMLIMKLIMTYENFALVMK